MSDSDNSGDDGSYPPLNALKPIADDVWIVDGPIIRFGPAWLAMPFPTRMTAIRTAGGLFVHSPTPLTNELQQQIAALGRPRWIVAPNRLHFWWVPDWRARFPDAEVYLAPGICERAGERITFEALPLDPAGSSYGWDEAIATLPVTSRYMTEFVFFHHASRTLLLTDLIENFQPDKLGFGMRWLTRLGGVLDPHGGMPRDMRLTFLGRYDVLRRAVEQMIAWNPERIILAHGRWYERNGTAEFCRAFDWLLGT